MKKFIKYTKIISLILLTLIFSLIVGFSKPYIYAQEKDLDFAIVNQDIGIKEEGKSIYYSQEFLGNIDNSMFTITNLSNAKSGIEENKYCGYIIIPENFSKNIENIKNNPEKIKIIYTLNYEGNIDITIDKLNKIINGLDTNISEGYINSVLTDVNNVTNNVNEIVNEINKQNIIVNGLTNFDFIKPIELKENQILNLTSEDINQIIKEYNDIDTNIKSQLQDDILTNTNQDRKDVIDDINSISLSLDQLENSKYYETKVQKLDLYSGYYLINNSQQEITILFDKTNGNILIKQPDNGYLVVDNGVDKYYIESNNQGRYFTLTDINTRLNNIVGDNKITTFSLFGNQLTIYGSSINNNNIEINVTNDALVINNAKAIMFNSDVYYPTPTGEIKFKVNIPNAFSNDSLENEIVNQINYNKLSSSIINELAIINNGDPNIPLHQAIDNVLNNPNVNNYFNSVSFDYNDITYYFNTINPSYFDVDLNSYCNNQTVANNINMSKDVDLNQTKLTPDEYNSTPPNLDYFSQLQYITINNNEICDTSNIVNQFTNLTNNLETYENNIVSKIDFSSIDSLFLELSYSMDEFVATATNQSQTINSINQENGIIIANYVDELTKKVIESIDDTKVNVQTTNENIINQLTDSDGKINYLRDGNTINYKLVKYMVNSIDLQNESLPTNKEIEDKNETNNWWIVPVTILGSSIIGVLIYKQIRSSWKGGD